MTDSAPQSPLREWWNQTLGVWLDIPRYWKDRQALLFSPELALWRNREQLSSRPLRFALQSLLLVPVLSSILSWGITHFTELPPDTLDWIAQTHQVDPNKEVEPLFGIFDIKGTMDERMAIMRRLHHFTESLYPIVLGICIVAGASLFRWLLRIRRKQFPAVGESDRIYLYLMGAHLFFPVTIYAATIYGSDLMLRFIIASGRLSPGHILIGDGLRLLQFVVFCWGLIALWRMINPMTQVLELKNYTQRCTAQGRLAARLCLLAVVLVTFIGTRLLQVLLIIFYLFWLSLESPVVSLAA
ncbi:MAG: hypothetical protein JSU95_14195 [Betaproteobacteria bacterium]|nr:MAG: hypothetical protein JSU95_14195 [Betaproteobacteria bacterium]